MSASPPVARPRTLDEVLAALAAHPEWTLVAGGTDVMVPVNDGRQEVHGWISLRDVAELRGVRATKGGSLIGAATTFDDLQRRHGSPPASTVVPLALSMAARAIGSPQIRNAGTVGGNIVTASPAADAVVAMSCCDATVELTSRRGTRLVPLGAFALGPKQTIRRADEVLTAVHLQGTGGSSTFAKVGTRNAMVIGICSLAARLDPATRTAKAAVGSVAPTVRVVPGARDPLLDPHGADDFADAVVAAAAPIDDVRATAAYRRHALRVVARRVHGWLWRDLRATDEGAA